MTKEKATKIFSLNLIRLLEEKKASQLDLAKYLGVSNTTVNNYVKGYNAPRMDKVDKIAEFFGVNREDLISDKRDSLSDTYFTNKEDAVKFLLEQKVIAAHTGIDINNYTDDQKIQIANRLLDYARMLGKDMEWFHDTH